MESTRQNKVSRLLLRELAVIFQLKGKEVAQGKILTVTSVRVSPDLKIAKVYVSIFPFEETIIEKIIAETSTFRNELGKKIRHQVKSIPELHFYIDDSLDYVDNIERLLKK